MKKQLLLNALLFVFIGYGNAQSFFDINAQITGLGPSTVIWGDYDNDNDLDCFVTGTELNGVAPFSALYQNINGAFTIVNNVLTNNPAGDFANAAFGDYDNDGDLDIIFDSKIYNNQNGIFTDINANLIQVDHGSTSWGDYDNDNDLDLLVTGIAYPYYHSTIYRNDNGTFININASLTGVWTGSGEWGDYDNDGDLDVLITGRLSNINSTRVTEVYKNTTNVFTLETSLPGIAGGSAKWGDYDNDNDLDILLTGDTNATNTGLGSLHYTELYRNDGTSFVKSNIAFTPMHGSFGDFVDYNDDGHLDIMLTGMDINGSSKTDIFLNNGSNAYNITTHNFMDLGNGTFDWADYNNDGLQDLLISGVHNITGFSFNVKIYTRNSTPVITGTDIITECDSLLWIDGNTYYANNNTVTFNIVGGATNLSDSLVFLDLTINTVNTAVTQAGTLLTADETGATYQWLDCLRMTPISGATSQTYTATANGDYAVVVTKNGCSDTSACYAVKGVGIEENNPSSFSLYPNPTTNQLTIATDLAISNVTIVDLTGKIIVTHNQPPKLVDVTALPKGIYFIQITTDTTIITKKFVKQ